MGILDVIFGSDEEQDRTQRAEPWKEAEDLLEKILGRTERRFDKGVMEMYPGQMYAPQTDLERRGIEALTRGADLFGQYMPGYMMSALNAPNIAENPVYQQGAEAIQRMVNRNLTENLLPAIGVREVGAGSYGTRGEVARGIAARGTSEALANALANMGMGAYETGLEAQSRAMSMVPGMVGLPGAMYGQAGALERAEAQRPISEAIQRWEYQENAPWALLERATNLALPIGSGFPTQTGSSSATFTPSPFQAIAGGVGLGAGLLGGGLFGGQVTQGYQPSQAYALGGYAPNPWRPWG